MQVTLIKLSKFISSPKILKANQMLISCFPYITLIWIFLTYSHKVPSIKLHKNPSSGK